MLLHHVKLQGFLAHRGQQVGGQNVPTEINFEPANLWLIHGVNGSGKSTVFDAITFALWDKARGSKGCQLVNDRCDFALVEVEFGVGEQKFRVTRRITLNKARDGHSSWSEVCRWNDAKSQWEIEAGVGESIAQVKDWAHKTLQISYENFASAVVLKQGEADRFLAAKPAERKDRLMELLDLDVYKRLGKAAQTQQTFWGNVLKDKQGRFDDCTPVTPAEIEAAHVATAAAKTRFDEAVINAEGAQKLKGNAERAAGLDAEIAAKEQLQTHDTAILDDETAIESAAIELSRLGEILPVFHALANARNSVTRAQEELERTQRAAQEAITKVEAARPLLERAQEQCKCKQDELEVANQSLENAKTAQQLAQGEATTLGQIESCEQKSEAARRELEPHRQILLDAPTIEARAARIGELRDAATLVKAVKRARENAAKAEGEHATAVQSHDELDRQIPIAQQAAADAQIALEENRARIEQLSEDERAIASELRGHRKTLQARQNLGDAVECPTCGTHLTDDEICRRLQQEQADLDADITRLETQQSARKSELESASKIRAQRQTVAKDGEKNLGELREKIAGARVSSESAQKQRDACQSELSEKRAEAGAFADVAMEDLRVEAENLGKDNINAELESLATARRIETKCQTLLGTHAESLHALPDWDDGKRAQVRAQVESCGADLTNAQTIFADAQIARDAATSAANMAREAHSSAQNELNNAESLRAQREKDWETARDALQDQTAKLPDEWKDHEAARETKAMEQLEARRDELKPQAQRRAELNESRQRRATLSGAIETLRHQKSQIPAEHCVPVAQAQQNLAEAAGASVACKDGWQKAVESESALNKASEKSEDCRRERDEAARQAGQYDDLARAFGRNSLQAKIVRSAQDDLKRLSNGILGRLSNGQWQIDLRGDNDKELEIIARDQERGAVRTFDCLSGGERFRVAISLAIAVGQMARGGAPMNTLVIDEGFGQLDEDNRALMVANLRHLSQRELQNGRIIVVSHQEDVCETFGHRYRMSSGADGYAQVEMIVG